MEKCDLKTQNSEVKELQPALPSAMLLCISLLVLSLCFVSCKMGNNKASIGYWKDSVTEYK